jgi:demethylmenaquinone methyltransferase/2-methoxy-6-polyprenyl-1,4-benzoquinol methylase
MAATVQLDRPMTIEQPVVPHPKLLRYYGDEQDRPGYVRKIFDDTARWYDLSTGILALGSGRWYRSKAMLRAGLAPGMRVLDLATGTGGVAAAARDGAEDLTIVGADISAGMLAEAKRKRIVTPVQTAGEELPFAANSFDLVSVGFAMRHFADLRGTFREIRRVLKPGGRVLILEITPPVNRLGRKLLEIYMRRLIPIVLRLRSGDRRVQELFEYYWDTTQECVPPATILGALRDAGFADASRHVEAFINSEYTGTAVLQS